MVSSSQFVEKAVTMLVTQGERPLSQGVPLLKNVHWTFFNSPLCGALLRHCAYGAGEFRRLRAATKGLLALWTSRQRGAALDPPCSGGFSALMRILPLFQIELFREYPLRAYKHTR